MSLYERRGGRLGRSLSLLIGDLSSNRPGPNLGFAACGGSTTALPIARSLPGATSCYLQWNNNNDNREREGSAGATDPLSWMNEIRELSRSPTDHRHKVWCFTPSHSPEASRHSSPAPCRRLSSGSPTPMGSDSSTGVVATPPSSVRKFAERVLRGAAKDCAAGGPAVDDRRQRVIGELIESERRYVANLETLLNFFLPSLELLVAPRDLRLMFPAQLEPLLEAHRRLLERLEERSETQSPFHGILGDIFGRLCAQNSDSEFINVYSAYMNEFKVAMQTLARYEQTSPEFKEGLQSCQLRQECEGLSLAAFLLTPIQRLPRYELLLKELLKQTPLEHPDNYYVGEAVDQLRGEMIRLNKSIQSCQLACSVARIRNGRTRSFRMFTKPPGRRPRRALSKLKRHVSTANIDEYSSGSELGGPIARPSSANNYCSEENLSRTEEDVEVGRAYPLPIKTAASCSDLLLDFDPEPRPMTILAPLQSLPSIPSTPENSSPSASSIMPPSSEDSCLRSRSRVSMYSTASSTSGIDSLGQSQLDLAAALTPTLTPTPLERDRCISTLSDSDSGHGGRRRKSSLVAALRMFGRLRKHSAPAVTKDISLPMDFRHIQHGLMDHSPILVSPKHSHS